MITFYILFLIFSTNLIVFGSPGDNHYLYRACLNHCKQINCSTPLGLKEFEVKQTLFEYIFQWSCPDECSYECMWKTVNQMTSNGQSVVQFHGKWPFVRLFGVQEPASTLFSILNLLSNYLFGYRVLRRYLRYGVHPLYSMWIVFCFICMNAWIWSTIFHTRDKPLTEIFDYIGAISLVFAQFACCLIRVGYRTKYMRLAKLATLFLFCFFIYHAYYLLFIKMDFGYNMTINIIVGLFNVICWLLWSIYHFMSGKIYVWRCALSVVLTMIFVGLELADFPPIGWTIDAHSLWHFSTIFLPILWYRFVVDDSRYLLLHSK
ncbi:unnamed protein product [Adineta steineri]|uniref:Post-GPI attachment to proteins factor 3 n=2 Tax=Adineta steineri TaxID=433720 RepID=A0A818YSF4_9BILA|nr:unnamed protein product [Adineta steineri]CAF3760654.1 unnamed protein product [Adineta steineri]